MSQQHGHDHQADSLNLDLSVDDETQQLMELQRQLEEMSREDQQLTEALQATQTSTEEKKEYNVKEQAELDARSIYVGNVDYSTKEDELKDFFKTCGEVERVTIPRDNYGGAKVCYDKIGYICILDGLLCIFSRHDNSFPV